MMKPTTTRGTPARTANPMNHLIPLTMSAASRPLGVVMLLALTVIPALSAAPPVSRIVVAADASPLEHYAAKELQRYIYQITGSSLEIGAKRESTTPCFVIAPADRLAAMKPAGAESWPSVTAADPGPQGYVLRKLTVSGQEVMVIGGSDAIGCLYGVYGMLEDHYGVGFYLGGDVLPDKKAPLVLPEVDERKAPAVRIRGFLPWTNFPQSATVYSWDDWRFIIDQAAKMRFNFIHIHNYNGEQGHNEMFHNFEVGGKLSRLWMPTARTGHSWGCPGWDVAQYRFGAADLFDDYDFGADCALHNESLSNKDIFRKGASLFQRIIAYAHSRGVRIGLGIDINIIPEEYKKTGAKAEDPQVVAARVEQIATDYPDLDYLLCFQSENVGHNAEFFAVWRRIFMGFYEGLKNRAPGRVWPCPGGDSIPKRSRGCRRTSFARRSPPTATAARAARSMASASTGAARGWNGTGTARNTIIPITCTFPTPSRHGADARPT